MGSHRIYRNVVRVGVHLLFGCGILLNRRLGKYETIDRVCNAAIVTILVVGAIIIWKGFNY